MLQIQFSRIVFVMRILFSDKLYGFEDRHNCDNFAFAHTIVKNSTSDLNKCLIKNI